MKWLHHIISSYLRKQVSSKIPAFAGMTSLMIVFIFLWNTAQAQELLPKGNSDLPVDIQADSLDVLQKDKVALFKGNVEAVQGTVHLKADEMRVYYKEKTAGAPASQNSVSKIDVAGNVFLATPEETVQGVKGVYDVEASLITLTDNVIITRGKNTLKGSGLTYDLKTGHSEMKGGAAPNASGKKERVRGVFVPEKKKTP